MTLFAYPISRTTALATDGARRAASRLFYRLNAPIAVLLALLQRTPVDRVTTLAEEQVARAPIGAWIQAAITTVASLGAIDSLAGATTLVATSNTPYSTTVGSTVAIGFTVSNTINIGSWKLTGTLPPGLMLSAKEGGDTLAGPGTLDATSPGVSNGYGGTTGGNSTTTPILSGSASQAGTYTFTLQAFEFGGLSGLASGSFDYTVTVAAVTTATAPAFTTQPQSATVTAGGSTSFTVAVSGSPTPTLQWMKNSTAISGATTATLTLNSVQASDGANYTVVATNSAGSTTSNPATLTVTAAATAPVITLQPRSQTATIGDSVTLSATVTGATSYQWQKGGAAIGGATSASYTLASVGTSDAGDYTLTATNAQGSAVSGVATLTISTNSPTGPAAWLSNLSVRSNMASGQTLIVGFTVAGGAENVLLRAVGPTLATVFPQFFPASSVMADPRISFYPSGASTATMTNDDWDPSVGQTIASLGAFPLPPGSKDAAVVSAVNGANNTAWVQGTGSGTVLVEAYALGSTNTPRLSNVSARNHVGTGADILIAGFVLKGTGTKKLLIRGIGPGLVYVFPQFFSASAVLADPKLEIHDSAGALVTTNNDWDVSLLSAFDAVGAYHFQTGSKDAAIIVDLPASAAGTSYTAQVSGADGGTGEGVVEVYELP